VAAAAAALLSGSLAGSAQSSDPVRGRAHRLHKEIIVLDTHADLTPFFEKETKPVLITDPGMGGSGYDAASDPGQAPIDDAWTRSFPPGPWTFANRSTDKDSYMDLPAMKAGGLDAEFFSIYMEREPRPGMAVKRSLDQIDAVLEICRKYSRDMELATTAADVRRIVASGKIAALMGVEGGYMIEDDLRVLRIFRTLGVRYMSLTHAFNTHWGDSSGVGDPISPLHNGLSPFGRAVVREMNRLGVIVDVSHTADKTFFDAIDATKAPVIASHSSVDGIKPHARNMSDEMLRALAKNGGVIQINAVTKYTDPVDRPATPLSVLIDHIMYAIKVAGPDHVGIGIDYGYDAPKPVDLEDCSRFENITYELLKRGVSDETVRKVWGENTLRVMAEAEKVAATLQRESGASPSAK
jgi:membrane dipeptidase